MTTYILVGIIVFFLAIIVFLLYCLGRAGNLINQYENFYKLTLDDVESQLGIFYRLTKENMLLSNDDSVKLATKSMQKFYDTLLSFYNTKKAGKNTG